MEWAIDGSLHSSGYGAPELKQCYRPYMSGSLAVSILLQVMCVVAYYVFRQPETKTKPFPGPVINIGSFPLPRPLSFPASAQGNSTARRLRIPNYAIPTPAPIPIVDSNSFYPTLGAFGANVGGAGDNSGIGFGGDESLTGNEENGEPQRTFQPVEKWPQVVKHVEPQYPKAAVRADIQGTVSLNLWVDKTGKVRKAEIVRSDNHIFDNSSVDAAMQWVFTPAIMDNKPVAVWITVPFKFRIREK